MIETESIPDLNLPFVFNDNTSHYETLLNISNKFTMEV